MSQIVRQSNLFAAEDFVKVYKSFQDIDFTAYDFDTIRNALITYIRNHFPEDFNDYVESSEFIAIIELLAFLGTSLAFRTDLNSRENILDTAERRESIIRLARTINYQPSRNIPLTGLFKISAVQTTQPLIDSDGISIGNTPIFWGDVNNTNWFDQFIQIINNCVNPVNPFGRPTKSGTVGSVPTDLYELNNTLGLEVAYNLGLNVNGQSIPIDVVNPDFDLTFFERNPDQNSPFNLIYRNDSLGVTSNSTGFFLFFKQGKMVSQDNRYNFPVPNRTTPINATNINQQDVYVQEITDTGTVIQQWTKVPSVTGTNIIYNSVNFNERNIVEVISENDDGVTLKFPDGNFGNIPTGIFRTWYRTSINRNITIRPEDARGLKITLPYTGADNQEYNLTLTFNLEVTANNGATSETNGQIKLRAPQAYYTQDRMINNEDYNVYPLVYGNQISKIRAINRTHAGHSRFIDINDPTGYHNNLIVLGEDGALYRDYENQRINVEVTDDLTGIISDKIYTSFMEFVKNAELNTFFLNEYLSEFKKIFGSDHFMLTTTNPAVNVRALWKTSPDKYDNNNGYLYDDIAGDPLDNAISFQSAPFVYIKPGSTLTFGDTVISSVSSKVSVGVLSVANQGVPYSPEITDLGPVELSSAIVDGINALEVVPVFRSSLNSSEIAEIKQMLDGNRENFGLGYDLAQDKWYIILETEDPNDRATAIDVKDSKFELRKAPGQNLAIDHTYANSWLVYFEYDAASSSYDIISRGMIVVFESLRDVRFYWDTDQIIYDSHSGKSLEDTIEILPFVNNTVAGVPLDKTIYWQLNDVVLQADGYQDPAKIEVLPADLNEDGAADNPYGYDTLVKSSDYVVFEKFIDVDGYQKSRPWVTGWVNMTQDTIITADVAETSSGNVSLMAFVGDFTGSVPISNGNLINIKDEAALISLADDLTEKLLSPTLYPYVIKFMDEMKSKTFRYSNMAIASDGKYNTLLLTKDGTADVIVPSIDKNHTEKNGRSFTQDTNAEYIPLMYKWRHYAPTDQRIDPSVSNIIDMLLITENYYQSILLWKDEDGAASTFPEPPTTEELRINFGGLDNHKATSDQIIYTSGKFKILFGPQAEPELQAMFKAVKIASASISDSELKTRIIEAVDEYFDINNWDFGERFYYTELAAYIHTRLTKYLSSIVIVPTKADSEFGNLFEIVSRPDELFLSTATVMNVQIVQNYTETNLRL